MGNDGGSIPTRRELVKNAAKAPNTTELKAALLEAATHAWTICPISNRPLSEPIVSDSAGVLYNKDAVLESLLPGDDACAKEDATNGRVKGLRDVVEVKFTVSKGEKGREDKWVCPITSKELGPTTKSVYLVPCGHAYSEVAIREVGSEACVECNESYTSDNVIAINPVTPEEVAKLAARVAKLREAGLTHSLKKAAGSKKRKKGAAATEPSQEKVSSASNGIKNSATASLTSKVLAEQEERNKRRKMAQNDNLKSLFSDKGYSAQTHKRGDFMTRGFSIPAKKD